MIPFTYRNKSCSLSSSTTHFQNLSGVTRFRPKFPNPDPGVRAGLLLWNPVPESSPRALSGREPRPPGPGCRARGPRVGLRHPSPTPFPPVRAVIPGSGLRLAVAPGAGGRPVPEILKNLAPAPGWSGRAGGGAGRGALGPGPRHPRTPPPPPEQTAVGPWLPSSRGSQGPRFQSGPRQPRWGPGTGPPPQNKNKSLCASVSRLGNGPKDPAACRAWRARGVDGPARPGPRSRGSGKGKERGRSPRICRRPARLAPKFENCQRLPNCAQERELGPHPREARGFLGLGVQLPGGVGGGLAKWGAERSGPGAGARLHGTEGRQARPARAASMGMASARRGQRHGQRWDPQSREWQVSGHQVLRWPRDFNGEWFAAQSGGGGVRKGDSLPPQTSIIFSP